MVRVAPILAQTDIKQAYQIIREERSLTNKQLIHYELSIRTLLEGINDALVLQHCEEAEKEPHLR